MYSGFYRVFFQGVESNIARKCRNIDYAATTLSGKEILRKLERAHTPDNIHVDALALSNASLVLVEHFTVC